MRVTTLRLVPPPLHLVLFVPLLAACRSGPQRSWPFPTVEAADDEAVLATLRRRTAGIGSLYGELLMGYEGGETSGVFELVVSYREPGHIRMTAFRDLLVSARGIFDLALTPQRFELVIEDDEGRSFTEGPAAELGKLHHGFRALAVLREALFLPGRVTGAATVARRDGAVAVHSRTADGAPVAWALDPRTLGVERALIGEGDGAIRIEYVSYREAGGRFFPERFVLMDASAGVVIDGALRDLELDPELDDALFRLTDLPAAAGASP